MELSDREIKLQMEVNDLRKRLAERNAKLERYNKALERVSWLCCFGRRPAVDESIGIEIRDTVRKALAPAQKEAEVERCGSPFDINKLCQRPKGHMRYDLNKFGSHELQSSAPDATPDAQREARDNFVDAMFDLVRRNSARNLDSDDMLLIQKVVAAIEILAAAKAGERR